MQEFVFRALVRLKGPKFEAEGREGVLGEWQRATSPPARKFGRAFCGAF